MFGGARTPPEILIIENVDFGGMGSDDNDGWVPEVTPVEGLGPVLLGLVGHEGGPGWAAEGCRLIARTICQELATIVNCVL